MAGSPFPFRRPPAIRPPDPAPIAAARMHRPFGSKNRDLTGRFWGSPVTGITQALRQGVWLLPACEAGTVYPPNKGTMGRGRYRLPEPTHQRGWLSQGNPF
jgi:hypothetical protein